MSAPVLKSFRVIKSIKKCCFAHSSNRITSFSGARLLSDDKSSGLLEEGNTSTHSLYLKLKEKYLADDSKVVETDNIEVNKEVKSSYVKAFERLEGIRTNLDEKPLQTKSFATLLRHSKLMQIGDISDKVVVGEIYEVHGDDLYIDFGGKFHCVCAKPQLMPWKYTRGVKVKVNLQSFEMSSKFIGAEKHVTLLEADATLLGLYNTKDNSQNNQ